MDIKAKMPYIAAAVDFMVKHRERTLGGKISSFGGVYDIKGKPSAWGITYECHAPMSVLSNEPDGEYGGWGTASEDLRVVFDWSKPGSAAKLKSPIFRNFSSWLVSPGSPYRSLWSQTPEGGIWVDGVDVTSDAFVADYGRIMPDLDVPANLLTNFFIMARQTHEHPGNAEVWHELVTKHGLDPNLSMYFAHHIQSLTPNVEIGPGIAHCALDGFSLVSVDRVYNFCRGDAKKPNHLYSKYNAYYPCNQVWGDSNDYPRYGAGARTYLTYIKKHYANLFGGTESKRFFPVQRQPLNLTISLDGLKTLIQAETKKIYG